MLKDQGARIEVDGGSGPGLEKRALQGVKVDGWVGLVTQLSLTILRSASPPCPDDPPLNLRAQERVASLTAPPFPSWVQCTQVGPEHNSLSVGVTSSIADLRARGLCVSVGVSVGVYVCVRCSWVCVYLCPSMSAPVCGYICGRAVCLNILCAYRVAVCLCGLSVSGGSGCIYTGWESVLT